MESEDFEAIERYMQIGDEEIFDDFEQVVGLAIDAKQNSRSMTSGSLPEGFESVRKEDVDFGFYADKQYQDSSIEIDYSERTRSFGKDSSTVEIRVEPLGYSFIEHWEQRM